MLDESESDRIWEEQAAWTSRNDPKGSPWNLLWIVALVAFLVFCRYGI